MTTITERFFALKATPPFDRLRDGELALLASVARERRYAPGEPVGTVGEPLRRLHVVVAGCIQDGAGRAMPAVLGVGALLFHRSLEESLTAAPPDGATCLLIHPGHFHTAIHECPSLLSGLLERA